MSYPLSLREFIGRVQDHCFRRIDTAGFCEDQIRLIRQTTARLFAATGPEDWGQPLGLFHAVFRAAGGTDVRTGSLLGEFCAFYILSADLFDDVQDDDLMGKPHENAGPAIAANSALALLSLALDALGEASAGEPRQELRLGYLRLFNRVSLIAVAAQHRDLLGIAGARSRKEIADMHRGKTSSVALICECAALAGGATPDQAAKYYQLGEELACAVQIVDDVRDLVAKSESTDLLTGKSTYPLACFFETATRHSAARMEALLEQRPMDLDAVVTLLEREGVFDTCAAAVEGHRQQISRLLTSVTPGSAHGRLLQKIVDHLAEVLYDPPTSTDSCPDVPGSLEELVSRCARDYQANMSEHGFGSVPELVSWHLPICLYQPDQNRIYYSDLDGLPEEVAPFHADLLAAQPEPTVDLLRDAMPFLIAHELTHAFRDQLGLLSGDAWLEEAIANEVAYAYVARHAEDTASAVLRLAERIVDRNGEGSRRPEEPCPTDADGRKQGVATDQNAEGGDYDCTPRQAAVRHAHMILAISSRKPRLEDALVTWFQPDEPLAAE